MNVVCVRACRWAYTVKLALENAGKTVSEADFERYFRRVYQFYGSASGYQALPDAESALTALAKKNLVLGVTSNTPGPINPRHHPDVHAFILTPRSCSMPTFALALTVVYLFSSKYYICVNSFLPSTELAPSILSPSLTLTPRSQPLPPPLSTPSLHPSQPCLPHPSPLAPA